MLLNSDDDGLAARPIYAWPDPVPPKRPVGRPDNSKLLGALRRLSEIRFHADEAGDLQPQTVMLAPDAADAFAPWWQHKQWEAKNSVSGKLEGAMGKLDGTTLRIALTLEYLSWAWGQSNGPEPDQVRLVSLQNALLIIDEWVRPNLERVFAEASLPEAQKDAMEVGRWLLRTRPAIVNARELRRQTGFSGPKEPKRLDAALDVLVDARWLFSPPKDSPGRPRKDFTVNQLAYEAR